jgi:hypothetical protein
MIYALLFALALFLNMGIALAFGMIGAFGLGYVAIAFALLSFAGFLFSAYLYQ